MSDASIDSDSTESTVSTTTNRAAHLERSLRRAQRTIAELERDIQLRRDFEGRLLDRQETLTAEKDTLTAEKATLTIERDALRQTVQTLQSNPAPDQGEVARLQRKLELSTQQAKDYHKGWIDLEKDYDALDEDLKALQSLPDTAPYTARIEKLQGDIRKLEDGGNEEHARTHICKLKKSVVKQRAEEKKAAKDAARATAAAATSGSATGAGVLTGRVGKTRKPRQKVVVPRTGVSTGLRGTPNYIHVSL
ncbi:MAG: hypothetical protein MMC33_000650 [Icmadophila ericetorum]|nr:hypothetical protein [Icmadophila ericetorum]